MIRVAWRSVRTHVGQFLMTILAVVLGVTFLSGTLALRGVLSDTFSTLVSSTVTADLNVTGKVVTESESSTNGNILSHKVDSSLAEQIQEIPGVIEAQPSGSMGALLINAEGNPMSSVGPPSMVLTYYGSEAVPTHITEGRAPKGAGEIIVEAATLKRSGLSIGDTTHVVIASVPYEVTVVGSFDMEASMMGAIIFGMDPEWLLPTVAPDGKVSLIEVYLEEGADEGAVKAEIQKLLPDNAEALTRQEFVDRQNAAIEMVLGFVQTFMLVFVVLAMFIGSFIIMNTFAMSVRQRQKEFALLRAVGASPRSVFGTVIFQAVIIGLLGSAIGLACGVGLTKGIAALVTRFDMPLPAGGIPLSTGVVVVSLVVGVVVTLVGALLPARTAALTPPVEAMRETSGSRDKPLTLRTVIGSFLTIAGVAGVVAAWTTELDKRTLILGIGAITLLVGLVIVSPMLARPLVRVLGLPLRIVRPGGRLAVRNLIQNPRRTAATSAALIVGIALVSAGATLAESTKSSIGGLINQTIKSDLMVHSASAGGINPVPAEFVDQIRATDGVASMTSITVLGVTVDAGTDDESIQQVLVVDPETFTDHIDTVVVSGMMENLDAGHVAAFEDSDWVVGDKINLTGPRGTAQVTVTAIIEENGISGSMVAGPLLAAQLGSWYTDVSPDPEQVLASPLELYVKVTDGADVAKVQDSMQKILAPTYTFEVRTKAEFASAMASAADQILAVLYALLALSIVIAALGIVNTLVLSVSERTREIGMQRAVGMGKSQLAGEIVCESVLTAVYGAVVGAATGVFLAGGLVSVLKSSGLTDFVIPWSQLLVIFVATCVVGVIAALWPALRATRLPVLTAIATE